MNQASRFMTWAALACLAVATPAWAGTPGTISFQGYLKDALDVPVTGIESMTFRIYATSVGGPATWSETKSIVVSNGVFWTDLGSVTALDQTLFSDSIRFLGIQVGTDPEMTRVKLHATPYAYRIATVDGSVSTRLVLSEPGNTHVELGLGADVMSVYDNTGFLRVKLALDALAARADGSAAEGGGAISFYRKGVTASQAGSGISSSELAGYSLVTLGESQYGTGQISTFDSSGQELARMTSTALDGGAYYTYRTDSTRLTVQGQALDTSGYIGTFGTYGNRSTALSSLVGSPGHGYISVADSSGTGRVGFYADFAGDGHISQWNHLGQNMVEITNTGYSATSDGGHIVLRGPNGSWNISLSHNFDSANFGQFAVHNSVGDQKAGVWVDNNGDGVVWGDIKSFSMANPRDPGTEVWYSSLEGPEAAAYTRGTATLVNGQAVVYFPEHFESVVSPTGITVQVTPLSANTPGLAVVEKHADRIVVRELQNGTGTFAFDYTVTGVRKGYEDYQVIRQARQLKELTKNRSHPEPRQSELRPAAGPLSKSK